MLNRWLVAEPYSERRGEPQLRISLSRSETEVLALIAEGHGNKTIARLRGVALETVQSQVRSVLAKLNCANRTQAAVFALRQGIIQ